MIVIKIGGSLLKDSEGLRKIGSYLKRMNGKRVLVVSALYGVTDLLISAMQSAAAGNSGEAAEKVGLMGKMHS